MSKMEKKGIKSKKFSKTKPTQSSSSEVFKCDFPGCKKTYIWKQNLRTHKRSHENYFQCICGRILSSAKSLKRHATSCHILDSSENELAESTEFIESEVSLKLEVVNQGNNNKKENRRCLSEFIDLYHSAECLWDNKHPNYGINNLRNEAYNKLVEKLKEIDPKADREKVTRKINTLRTTFRREYRKTISKPNYEPRLWYYKKLLFMHNKSSEPHSETANSPSLMNTKQQSVEQDSLSDAIESEEDFFMPRSTKKPNPSNSVRQYKDEYDDIGVYLANKLRAINAVSQRLMAEKLINDVIFNAHLGNLTESSKLIQIASHTIL